MKLFFLIAITIAIIVLIASVADAQFEFSVQKIPSQKHIGHADIR